MAMEGKILGLAERAGGSVPAPISLFSEQGAVVLDPSGVKAGHRDFRGIRIRFRLPSGGFAYTTLFTEKGPGCSNIVVDPSGDPQFAKGAMGVDGTDCCEEISDPGTKNTSPEAARAILAAIEEALGAAAENQGFESAVPRPPTGVPHLARQPIRADRAETEGYLSRFQAAVDGVLGACSGLTNEASYQSRLSRLRQFEVSFLARHGSK